MNIPDTENLEIAINSAHNEANKLSDENQSRIAQLTTVWVSGYLEVAFRNVLLTYAARTSSKSVLQFVARRLERIRSPNTRGILDLVRSFDEGLATELEKFVQDGIKDNVDSVVAVRNRIAHGQPVDTTLARVERQFEASRKLAEKMKELFDAAA